MSINIDYQFCLDWGHCEEINQASERLSRITNLLNKVLVVRQGAKKDILLLCADYPEENFSKKSWENKMVRLSEISRPGRESVSLWQDADTAYRQLRFKQEIIMEDLLKMKKLIDITPK